MAHFILLYERAFIYGIFCRVFGDRICFGGCPYFVLSSILPILALVVVPLPSATVIDSAGAIQRAYADSTTTYVMFSGGATLATAAIPGRDVYPVNVVGTEKCLGHLIAITRDPMKFSNRCPLFITGSVILGWVFKKVEVTPGVIHTSAYGVLGLGLGGAAVRRSRVTDFPYRLSELEIPEG